MVHLTCHFVVGLANVVVRCFLLFYSKLLEVAYSSWLWLLENSYPILFVGLGCMAFTDVVWHKSHTIYSAVTIPLTLGYLILYIRKKWGERVLPSSLLWGRTVDCRFFTC